MPASGFIGNFTYGSIATSGAYFTSSGSGIIPQNLWSMVGVTMPVASGFMSLHSGSLTALPSGYFTNSSSGSTRI